MQVSIHSALMKLQEEKHLLAETAMLHPKKEPFDHGCQVGVWQGLDRATQIIDEVLRDIQEIDSRL